MASYLELINQLRNKFNEVALTTSTFASAVGFDQFSKEAINYAYHDILNAEMEWPFLHEKTSFITVPGVQLYPVTTANSNVIKEIDWDSFFVAPNTVVTEILNEAQAITSTLLVTPTNVSSWSSDLGVTYTSSGIALTATDRDPLVGQYTIKQGLYYFNVSDVSKAIKLNYTTTTISTININTAVFLPYIDYDNWRQTRLAIDLNNIAYSSYSQPQAVFKTQTYGEIGLTPIPDKVYIIDFECWVDITDLVDTTDTPIIPTRFNQVIIDGASKYCYEFREDPQAAVAAEKKFNDGVIKMRRELINSPRTMATGFRWRNHSYDYTLNTW